MFSHWAISEKCFHWRVQRDACALLTITHHSCKVFKERILREPQPTLRCRVGVTKDLFEGGEIREGGLINPRGSPPPLRRRQDFQMEVWRLVGRTSKEQVPLKGL